MCTNKNKEWLNYKIIDNELANEVVVAKDKNQQ